MRNIHVAIFLIGVLLTSSVFAFQAWSPKSGPQGPTDFRPAIYSQSLPVFHTVEYARSIVGGEILVPDAALAGPGYRLVGVIIAAYPHNVTNDVGVTSTDWDITFVLSDRIIISGVTTYGDVYGHYVTVDEAYVGTFDSHAAALDFLSPGYVCSGPTNNKTQSCSTYANTGSLQLIEVRNTWMVVSVSPATAAIYIGAPVYRGISISGFGTLDYSHMMALADSMIP